MAAPPSYRRVGEDGSTTTTTRSRSDRFMDKIYAIIWIGIALGVAKWTRFAHVLLSPNDLVVKPLLYAAAALLGILTILVLYLVIYLPKIKGVTDSSAWDVVCPKVVPTMTACGLLSFLFLVRATWPVWGFLSPLILGTELFGGLFALHFVPWL